MSNAQIYCLAKMVFFSENVIFVLPSNRIKAYEKKKSDFL